MPRPDLALASGALTCQRLAAPGHVAPGEWGRAGGGTRTLERPLLHRSRIRTFVRFQFPRRPLRPPTERTLPRSRSVLPHDDLLRIPHRGVTEAMIRGGHVTRPRRTVTAVDFRSPVVGPSGGVLHAEVLGDLPQPPIGSRRHAGQVTGSWLGQTGLTGPFPGAPSPGHVTAPAFNWNALVVASSSSRLSSVA